jgi:hypothetical protein
MSTRLKGVALGLSVPVVLAISAWTGWSALTANLPPAEISDEFRRDVSESERAGLPTAKPQIEPGPSPDRRKGAAERAQPRAPGPDRELAVAPASVSDPVLTPTTTGQAELPPPKPRIRFVRVPKALAAPHSTSISEPASGENMPSEVTQVGPARRQKKARD